MCASGDLVSVVLNRDAIFVLRDVLREDVDHLERMVGDSSHVDDLVDVEVLGVLKGIFGVVDGICVGLNSH